MKITILGAAGLRTPLLVKAIAARQERLGLDELALMDVDGERLELIADLTTELAGLRDLSVLAVTRTTDSRTALAGADFVITTFRVGGIASRIVDERVPLRHGVLGQETTGPGGFAMAMRTIPVLLDYVKLMRQLCPHAWLINFANPSGLLAQAATGVGRWERTVGICDAPHQMGRVAAALLGVSPAELFLDYFGLNHLGWVRGALCHGQDTLPHFIGLIRRWGGLPGLPFDPEFIAALGLIPNEYLYYYYHATEAVQNILRAGQTRGEQIASLNEQLFADLQRLRTAGDQEGMEAAYRAYLGRREGSYMVGETADAHSPAGLNQKVLPQSDGVQQALADEGYAGVALNLIEALTGHAPGVMILNVPNCGAIRGMAAEGVVEIPVFVGRDLVRPLAVGAVPDHALGLMQQVKAYEQLTIAAATEGSRAKAIQALTIHPLVRDHTTARIILDEYTAEHGALWPELSPDGDLRH
jgi:6-phospho-beta-glucosidase